MIEILILAAALGTTGLPRDTVMDVRPGDELVIPEFRGSVRVEPWDRSQLYLGVEGEEGVSFRLDRRGDRIHGRIQDSKGRNRDQDLFIRVPAWMALEISGREFDAHIQGIEGSVEASNIDGEITLIDLSGDVRASSQQGEIDAVRLSGSAQLSSGDDRLRVRDSDADLQLGSVDGDIDLVGSRSRRIKIRSTDGDVTFQGKLMEGGEYEFHTHGGDVRLRLAPPVHMHATVLAYDGEFESDFPVRTSHYRSGHGLDFTVGDGSSRLTIETFNGEVELRRDSGMPTPEAGRASATTTISDPTSPHHRSRWRQP
jgi:hypothetical protein